MKLNLPNKLTLLRCVLVPVFLALITLPENLYVACIGGAAVFAIASFTDMLDGKIARSRGLITDFGKFMDPLADKLLVCSALICLVSNGKLPAWIVIIIISREFIISGFRLIASDNGVVIAAGYWGKFKTTFQMLMVIVLILDIQTPFFHVLGVVLTYVALILTVISLFDYLIRNKDVLKEQK